MFTYIFKKNAVIIPVNQKFKTIDKKIESYREIRNEDQADEIYKDLYANYLKNVYAGRDPEAPSKPQIGDRFRVFSVKPKMKVYFESYRIEYIYAETEVKLDIPTYPSLRNDIIKAMRQYSVFTCEDIILDPKTDILIEDIERKLSAIDSNSSSDYEKFLQLLELLANPANYSALAAFQSFLKRINDIRNPSLISPCLEFKNSAVLPTSFPARVNIGNKTLDGVDPHLIQEAWDKFCEQQKLQHTSAVSNTDLKIHIDSLQRRYKLRKEHNIPSHQDRYLDDEGCWHELEIYRKGYRTFHEEWLRLAYEKKDLASITYFASRCDTFYKYSILASHFSVLDITKENDKEILEWSILQFQQAPIESIANLDIANEFARKIMENSILRLYKWQDKLIDLKDKYTSLYLETDNCLTKIRKLFSNYTNPNYGLFLTFHWDRHHVSSMTELENKLTKLADKNLLEAKILILTKILEFTKHKSSQGSFSNRLCLALMLLDEEIAKQNKLDSQTLTTTFSN